MMYPREECIKEIIYKLRQILFPEHFEKSCTCSDVKMLLEKQVVISLMHRETPIKSNVEKTSQEIADVFFESLHELKQILLEDAAAGFNGDPAAYSIDEIILAYPGFFATLVYRMAHILIVMGVPLIPRMMCEFAHSKTGIDIHPKAEIGRHFFIDHGTGVVIGETASIGNNVKIYQGVTIGALSTENAKELSGKKRHPTVEDDVVIYAGAAILGGETVIGKGTTIGGNAFVTASVSPENKIKGGGL